MSEASRRATAVPPGTDHSQPATKPVVASSATASSGVADVDSRTAAVIAALDRLDAQDDRRFRNRRASDRIRYRRLDVPARFKHPGGSDGTATVATRNLSASGVGLLVNRFLHTGTRVELVLHRMLDGAADLIVGKVAFCTHVGGTMHQVGVRFDQKVFPSLYVDVPFAG